MADNAELRHSRTLRQSQEEKALKLSQERLVEQVTEAKQTSLKQQNSQGLKSSSGVKPPNSPSLKQAQSIEPPERDDIHPPNPHPVPPQVIDVPTPVVQQQILQQQLMQQQQQLQLQHQQHMIGQLQQQLELQQQAFLLQYQHQQLNQKRHSKKIMGVFSRKSNSAPPLTPLGIEFKGSLCCNIL